MAKPPIALGGKTEAERDLREILKAWALGDHDKMAALMLPAFLREFGKAPDLSKEEEA